MTKKCDEMVTAFLPLYLEYIAQFDDPTLLCHLIRFCSEGPQQPVIQQKYKLFAILNKAKNGTADSCATCKSIVGELQALVRNPDMQKEIVSLLKADVCPLFKSSQQQCETYVDEFAPTLFSFLATWLDPDARCTAFGFCPSVTLPVVHQTSANAVHHDTPKLPSLKPHEVSAPDECAFCELVLNALKSMLQKNSTEEEIIKGLDKLCSMLPGNMSASCKSFVEQYVPAIITMLREEVDPAQVCQLLGLCTKTPKTLIAQVKGGDTCIVCETLVQYVEALVEDKATVEEIEKVLKKACNFLPQSMRDQCSNIVDTYGAMIIHLVATKYTPEQVCQMIKLCDQMHGEPQLIGSNKCTQGPAYWCNSAKHAEECGASEHCKKFVWKN